MCGSTKRDRIIVIQEKMKTKESVTRVREYGKKNWFFIFLTISIALAAPVLTIFVNVLTGVIIGEIAAALALWLGLRMYIRIREIDTTKLG